MAVKHSILLKVDDDDLSDYSFYKEFENCQLITGLSKSKIDAINRGDLLQYTWDILLNHSDDMYFVTPRFDEVIIEDMQTHFPDRDGVLHYSDGYTNLFTYSIIGRKYFERDNYIYHPDYISLWCDNEAQLVAQTRGKYQFIDKRILEHRHPYWGHGHYDQQYHEQGAFYRIDEQTFNTRKERNFDL